MRTSAATPRVAGIFLCLVFFPLMNLFAFQASGSLHGAATDPSGARVVKATHQRSGSGWNHLHCSDWRRWHLCFSSTRSRQLHHHGHRPGT